MKNTARRELGSAVSNREETKQVRNHNRGQRGVSGTSTAGATLQISCGECTRNRIEKSVREPTLQNHYRCGIEKMV